LVATTDSFEQKAWGGQGVRATPGSMNIVQLKLLALYRKA